MTKIELEQTIIKETQNLPYDTLREILDFIQFKKQLSSDFHKLLSNLDETSLIHLESEFKNYKEIYQREQ